MSFGKQITNFKIKMAAVAVSFEVFGKVQGVFFRKYTKKTASSLQLVGWVMNTNYKTVLGYAQGSKENIDQMKRWLRNEGSPKSRIDRCVFKDEKEIASFDFTEFTIKR